MKKKMLIIAISMAAAFAVGCSTTTVLKDARTKLDEAQARNAGTFAPYEFSAAQHYLEFAEEEAEDFDYKAAKSFASTSIYYSEQAIEKSNSGGAR